jgi:platelet-activating factor acetylhydrolase isoform II
MLKQRSTVIVALVIAVLIGGCDSGTTSTGPAPIQFVPPPPPAAGGFVALYAPPVDVVPYPNDIYNPTGSKLAVPVKITSPLASALNTVDGFSTTAVISALFNAPIDPASVVPWNPLAMAPTAASLIVFDATNATPLVPGVDYQARLSTAAGTEGTTIEILPLRPLRPRTRYLFYLTTGIRSAAGQAAGADTVFRAVRDAHLAGLTSVPGAPQLTPLFPVIAPLMTAATQGLGLSGTSILVAWSMQTQSISNVLDVVAQGTTARTAVLANTGMTTAQLGVGLPGLASIYTGFIEVPYYGDPANPLTTFWLNAQQVPPNVTNPTPVPRVAAKRIPLLATLPSPASGRTQPPAGWPVVIFQHGITLNRTVMFAMADSFAQQGFAVVAIDLPLHGVTDTTNPLYQGPGSPFGNNERHSNLDNVGAVGVFAPDGQIDNGWQILNVQNPLNARDHIRQAVADTLQLTRTLPVLNFPDGDPNPDLDGARIHFVGISLGSIISGVFLGLDSDVSTATLSSPAGPWTSILTDPEAIDFGGPIRNALSAQGLPPGTVGFEAFVRDLQTVIDPVDPVNYATQAAALHPLHVIEVLGDPAVPNGPTDYIASLWGLPSVHTTVAVAPPATASGIVRFNAGGHSSLFNPAIDPAVTAEMQRQTVTYAVSGGSAIQITNTAVVD